MKAIPLPKPIHIPSLPVLGGPKPHMVSFTEGEVFEAAKQLHSRTHARFLPANHPIAKAQNTTVLYVCYESRSDDVALCLDFAAQHSMPGGTVYLVPLSDLTNWKF